jgi:hypothetical protein
MFRGPLQRLLVGLYSVFRAILIHTLVVKVKPVFHIMSKSFSIASCLCFALVADGHLFADDDIAAAFEDADVQAAFAEAVDEKGETSSDDDPATKVIKELIGLGGGATPISIGKRGEVESMLVVGAAPIPKSLPGPKGKDLATKAARREVIKHFIRFLSEDASIFETADDEVIIATEGSAIEGELNASESSKALNKSTEKFESSAQGLARGLEIIARKVDANGQTIYLAYGWSKENDAAAEALSQRKSGTSSARPGTAVGPGTKKPSGDDLQDEEVISSRAAKFFKKN